MIIRMSTALLILFAAVFTGATVRTSEVSESQTQTGAAITNQSAAITAALEYTGFQQCPGFVRDSATCSTITKKAGNLAVLFAPDYDPGSSIWKVTFRDISLFEDIIDTTTGEPFSMDFEAFIDSATGCLIKLVSSPNPLVDSSEGNPWSELHDDWFLKNGQLVTSLTAERPQVTLYDAVKAGCQMMPIVQASDIVIYYGLCHMTRQTIQKWVGRNPEPAWLIVARHMKLRRTTYGDRGPNPQPIMEGCFVNARTGIPSGTLTASKGRLDW